MKDWGMGDGGWWGWGQMKKHDKALRRTNGQLIIPTNMTQNLEKSQITHENTHMGRAGEYFCHPVSTTGCMHNTQRNTHTLMQRN